MQFIHMHVDMGSPLGVSPQVPPVVVLCLTGLSLLISLGWWASEPRDLPVSTSLVLGLQAHLPCPAFSQGF